MKRSKVLFICLIPLLLLLSACGNLVLEIDKDGSGQVVTEIPNNGFISSEMVKSELESEFDEGEGVSKPSVKEKDDMIQVEFQFDDISNVDSDSYQIPVSDYVVTSDSRLESLEWDGEIVEFEESSSGIFIQLPGDMNSFDQARIVLPGDVVAHTDNVEIIEKDTVEITSSGQVYVVYEPKSGMNGFIWAGLIIVIAAAVFFYKRKNNENQPKIEQEGEVHA